MTSVLLIDSDLDHAQRAVEKLRKLRPELVVTSRTDRAAAAEVLARRAFDVIVCDLPAAGDAEGSRWLESQAPSVGVFGMSSERSAVASADAASSRLLDCFDKPLDVHAFVDRLAEAVAESVQGELRNVSLASLLQLLEMERKSCRLSVRCGERTGTLVVHKGQLVDARTGELGGESAAISVVAWPNPIVALKLLTQPPSSPSIHRSLGFIVMEAMRVHDEAARLVDRSAERPSSWPLAHRSWRPMPAAAPAVVEISEDPVLPSGAQALAVVETATGRILRSTSAPGCPLSELAMMASHVMRQEAVTLQLCGDNGGVEELVMSTTSRCDVIRPLSSTEFALLVFEPEQTNLMMARFELEQFVTAVAVQQADLARARARAEANGPRTA